MSQQTPPLTVPASKQSAPLPTIGRHPTANELSDWTGGVAGGATAEKIYRETIKQYQQRHTKDNKPYDASCAIQDMREVLEKVGKEKQRYPEQALNTAEKLKKYMPNFSKYGAKERFTFISYTEAWEPKGKNTNEKQYLGMRENYTCVNGCKFSILVPTRVWIERNSKEAVKIGLVDKEGELTKAYG